MAITEKNVDPGLLQRGSVPVPDPTLLTTQALREAIGNLKELVETRFKEQDKALRLLQDISNQAPTVAVIEQMIKGNRELSEERIEGIRMLANERLKNVETKFADDKITVSAAFAAQEALMREKNEANTRAINKSESSVSNEITAIKQRIDELRETVGKGEGRTAGAQGLWAVITVVASLSIAGISVAVAILSK